MAGVVSPTGDIGPVEVWWNSVKIGETKGDTIFRCRTTSRPVMEDALGVAPVDYVQMGMEECSVIAPLTRMSIAQLADIIPGATTSGTGSTATLRVNSNVGLDTAASAKQLILKRIYNNAVATDETDWLSLPLAYPVDIDMEVQYSVGENQRVFPVTFQAFPATVLTTAGVYWGIGDLSAD